MEPDSARIVYDGKLFDVTVVRWGEHEREIVEHPGAVAVVAVDTEGMLTLVRQRREAARKHLLELEETGLTGGTWRELAAFYTTPGFCRERMHLFVADGLERGRSSPETDEELEVVRWPTSEIAARLHEIEDAKTLVGLLLYLHGPEGRVAP
ncbi:MAG: NUDIX hydrolase [Actinobacteria bacterium]|nr:MAG: NUDIX hydrolase [Actinomycetota bacterium]